MYTRGDVVTITDKWTTTPKHVGMSGVVMSDGFVNDRSVFSGNCMVVSMFNGDQMVLTYEHQCVLNTLVKNALR